MAKIKLFIDFDSTIFDSGKFKDILFGALKTTGADSLSIEETYELVCRDYKYSPDKHVALLKQRLNIDDGEANYLAEEAYKKTPDFIYSDAIEFLKKIDRSVYEVNILSFGDDDFQRKKIANSRIENYFDHIFVTEEQKWICLTKMVARDEHFIMIDDRGDTINNIGRQFPQSLAIEINRIGSAGDPMEPIVEYGNIVITNFSQLMNIIRKHEGHARVTRS